MKQRTPNVPGLVPASDAMLRDEIVVVGAHFDGQGRTGEADMGRRPPPEGLRRASVTASGTPQTTMLPAPRRSVPLPRRWLPGGLHAGAHCSSRSVRRSTGSRNARRQMPLALQALPPR